tara:strand:+ start:889 stop:2232 length:1344 start_codon:yes stop_codon:yes gene_type:complete
MGLLDGTTQQAYYQGNDHGNYQFTSLADIINQFMVVYVGEDKLISNANRIDVAFHAQRALQELSFDTLKSCKAQEITVPASLQMILPQDYVNYTKISWVDSAGIKHLLYPTSKTSNPPKINQNTDGTYYSNLVLNPDFQNGIDNWGKLNVGSSGLDTQLNHTTSSDGLLLSSNGLGANPFPILQQSVTLVDGQTYQLSWNITSFSGSNVFLYGGPGGVNTYRPAGDNIITATGAQTAIEFTYDASQNNNINTMMLAIQVTNGNTTVKSVGVKDFLLVRINNDGNYGMDDNGEFVDSNDSTTWSNYKSGTPPENQDDYQDDTYWPMDGSRYGLDPQHAQANGSFYIDCVSGKIHFSSNIAGKTVILDYISDSLGSDGEMQVHKFAEEAMYKWMSHGILSGKANIPEYQVNRLKKERFAAIRTAKLRLSNLKLEELTQILRGKSKQIKH